MTVPEQIEIITAKLKELDKLGKKKPHTRYTLADGTVIPSTTTINSNNLGWNKYILIKWSKKMQRENKDSEAFTEVSARIGTLAHYFAECYVKKEPIDREMVAAEYLVEEVKIAKTAYQGFKKWADKHNPIFKHSEVQLVSEEYKYGGTIDLILEVDGKLCIYDIKTSNSVHTEMILQLAAYRHLYEANYALKITSATIIKISKDEPEYELHYVDSDMLDKGWEAFKSLITINRMHDELKFSRI